MKNVSVKQRLSHVIAIFCCCLLLVGCKKIKKSDAEYEREQWIEGFADSIAFYQGKTREVESELEKNNHEIGTLLENFGKVSNPREVTGYYLLNGWQSKLPLTSTGIYARINENEKLELIATLAGATFNRIGVGDGNEEYKSNVVPHDQAFNYRHQKYNTVYFTGGKADTIAEYISRHHDDKVVLQFIEGDKSKNFAIPEDERAMIHKTWILYSLQLTNQKLQRELWICSRKIDTFRRIMDENSTKDEALQ
ncbi:MAG: hypothetical protein J1F43_09235 [Muribaculaceae bacterium]|nr:hypothetical protein [Muribaculaceae bacterium]